MTCNLCVDSTCIGECEPPCKTGSSCTNKCERCKPVMTDLEILQEVYGDLKYWTVDELALQFKLIELVRQNSNR